MLRDVVLALVQQSCGSVLDRGRIFPKVSMDEVEASWDLNRSEIVECSEGRIPAEWIWSNQIPKLRILISESEAHGMDFQGLAQCLIDLDLSGQNISRLDSCLSNCDRLKTLNLNQNKLQTLENLPDNLETLFCSGNFITAVNLPTENKANIRILVLGNNQLSDIDFISGCSNLKVLDLSANQLPNSGRCALILSDIPSVQSIYLENNPFSLSPSYIQDWLPYFQHLKYIDGVLMEELQHSSSSQKKQPNTNKSADEKSTKKKPSKTIEEDQKIETMSLDEEIAISFVKPLKINLLLQSFKLDLSSTVRKLDPGRGSARAIPSSVQCLSSICIEIYLDECVQDCFCPDSSEPLWQQELKNLNVNEVKERADTEPSHSLLQPCTIDKRVLLQQDLGNLNDKFMKCWADMITTGIPLNIRVAVKNETAEETEHIFRKHMDITETTKVYEEQGTSFNVYILDSNFSTETRVCVSSLEYNIEITYAS